MTLQKFIENCRELSIDEIRSSQDDQFEAVFFTRDIADWLKALEPFIGEPKKGEGVKPTREDKKVSSRYGGIWKEQTLFYKDCENGRIVAMFWPWQDSQRTTLKMYVEEK